jgi:hypothetical protein
VLREIAQPVKVIDGKMRKLASDMLETMYSAPGVGLAAPQVGVGVRLIVIDAGDGPRTLFNPEIVWRRNIQWDTPIKEETSQLVMEFRPQPDSKIHKRGIARDRQGIADVYRPMGSGRIVDDGASGPYGALTLVCLIGARHSTIERYRSHSHFYGGPWRIHPARRAADQRRIISRHYVVPGKLQPFHRVPRAACNSKEFPGRCIDHDCSAPASPKR